MSVEPRLYLWGRDKVDVVEITRESEGIDKGQAGKELCAVLWVHTPSEAISGLFELLAQEGGFTVRDLSKALERAAEKLDLEPLPETLPEWAKL